MRTRQLSSAARVALLTVNGAGVLIAAGFAAQGLVKPNFSESEQPVTPLSRFWAASSAVRTWSLAIPMLIGLTRRRPTSGILVAAGLVQLGDSALGVWRRNRQMAVAPAIMAAIHLVSARLLTD